MGFSAIFDIVNKVMSWFTPEQRAKSKREKREILKKEITKLKRLKCTDERAKKLKKLEDELEKINNSLGA